MPAFKSTPLNSESSPFLIYEMSANVGDSFRMSAVEDIPSLNRGQVTIYTQGVLNIVRLSGVPASVGHMQRRAGELSFENHVDAVIQKGEFKLTAVEQLKYFCVSLATGKDMDPKAVRLVTGEIKVIPKGRYVFIATGQGFVNEQLFEGPVLIDLEKSEGTLFASSYVLGVDLRGERDVPEAA